MNSDNGSSLNYGALSQAVRENPLPAALITAGLLWLLSGKGGGASAEEERFARPDSASGARRRLADLLNRQPLALGAIGLGVGAAMASTFGVTKAEAGFMGEASTNVQETALKLAASAGDSAATAASRVMFAVADEAKAQGLTPDAIRQSTSDLSERVGRVARESTQQMKTP
jgi:hypothetical protein